jgi:hypothetical protein
MGTFRWGGAGAGAGLGAGRGAAAAGAGLGAGEGAGLGWTLLPPPKRAKGLSDVSCFGGGEACGGGSIGAGGGEAEAPEFLMVLVTPPIV